MKTQAARFLAAAVLAALAALLLAGASKPGPVLQPDKLVLLSTTDVKGKTSPCG
jgi:hypothetical protein